MLLITALAALAWAEGPSRPVEPAVQIGAQRVLEPPYFDEIRGKRIGVLAHPASLLPNGEHLVDLLHRQDGVKLEMIFAPEHGFRGGEDVQLPDTVDPKTGLPVYSLYGPRQAPTPELLARIDAVVIDLQDVGVRFYTYASTMAFTMQACKAAGKKVIVLDRPNPIGGSAVEGAVLEKGLQGNIASLYPTITRHGMTMGELARLYNADFGIGADLRVVPMSGWKREMLWDETGLPWIAPSPALTEFEQASLYGTFGGLESLNLAVGRGITNEQAFRIFGAPWIAETEARALVVALNRLQLPGLSFEYVQWIPTRREYEGKLCRGFRVRLSDRGRVEGFRSMLEVLRALHAAFGSRVDLESSPRFLGTRWLKEGILAGLPVSALMDQAFKESREFRAQRERALLY